MTEQWRFQGYGASTRNHHTAGALVYHILPAACHILPAATVTYHVLPAASVVVEGAEFLHLHVKAALVLFPLPNRVRAILHDILRETERKIKQTLKPALFWLDLSHQILEAKWGWSCLVLEGTPLMAVTQNQAMAGTPLKHL